MESKELHYELSVMIARVIRAEPLRCWRNAALALLSLPQLFSSGTYVEGWIVIPKERNIVVCEHGWTMLPEGGVVDPSIVLLERPDQPLFYFPGFELSQERLSQHIAGKILPLVCHSQYGEDGMGHRDYAQSYTRACQCARELADTLHLPQEAIQTSSRDQRLGWTVIGL